MQICTMEIPDRQLRHIKVPDEAPQKIVDLFFSCREVNPSMRITAHEALKVLNTTNDR